MLEPTNNLFLSLFYKEYGTLHRHTIVLKPARVAELADAGDSKSPSLRGVRVQVPPRAPF